MESRDKYPNLERDPRPSRGLGVPLFERLTSSGEAFSSEKFGSPPEPFRTLDPNATIESIRRDLQRLLNTRTPPGASAADGRTVTSINYGLPDFAHISPADVPTFETLAKSIGRVIEAFEPRIGQVRVTLKSHPSDPCALVGAVEGNVRIGLIAEPVYFPLEMLTGAGSAVVGESETAAKST
jgi:type VI secretion system lysozyme-like protein